MYERRRRTAPTAVLLRPLIVTGVVLGCAVLLLPVVGSMSEHANWLALGLLAGYALSGST